MSKWAVVTNSAYTSHEQADEVVAYRIDSSVPSLLISWGDDLKDIKKVEFPPNLFLQGAFRRKLLERNRAEWFVPMVERMAAGEDVTLDEIEAAYREHNGGKEMPKGTWGELQRRGEV